MNRIKLFILVIKVLTISVLISACGDSTPDVGPIEESNALIRLNNTVLTLSIDNMPVEGLPDYLPQTDNNLIQFFGEVNDYYWQSDKYNGWQYRGEFEYSRDENNAADLTISMSNELISYQLHYDFTDKHSGQWQLDIKVTKSNETSTTETLVLHGSFTASELPKAQDYNFKGELITNQQFSSAITGIDYPYHVYLPENYFQSDRDYPVIFATDGQWEYWRFAHAIEASELDIILVAIEQGPNDRRLHDYALTGSNSYLDFLSSEMLPFIASQFRIDETDLALQGASWGGLLVRHALIREVTTPLFSKFIAMDGSYFHDNNVYQSMEKAAFTRHSLNNKQLYLSGALINGNDALVQRYQSDFHAYDATGLAIYYQAFYLQHNKVTTPSIKDALITLYK